MNENKTNITIGVYTEDEQLIGYKVDTFWSLSKTYAKVHTLEDGKIPPHIIKNLISGLRRYPDLYRDWLNSVPNNKYETMLIGYIVEDDAEAIFYKDFANEQASDAVIYTHRIFDTDVQELDD